MVIVIDFDETLFPTLEKVIEIYNQQHDKSLSLSQIVKYNLYECLDENTADEILGLFVDKAVYDSLQPYKGAVRVIKTLIEQGNDIYIATASDLKNMEWKERLLQKYFPFIPKNNLIRIYNKKLLNCDILIDDNMNNLTSTFADRICFNQFWNQSESKDFAYNISRVHYWGEVLNVIQSIERKDKEWEK